MFWTVLGRILWAQRAIVLITVLCCLAGGTYIVLTVTPSYDATARVVMNNITKADPALGMVVSTKTVDAYVRTQISMIRDVQVVAPALESIGWMDDPNMISAYGSRPANDTRDYPTWLAQRIIPGLQAYPVEDSNMLEIRFRAPSRDLAKLVVGAIRDAYITSTVADRRAGAEGDANFQSARAEALRVELVALQAKQAELARKTGILWQPGVGDLDTRRLSELAAPQRPGAGFNEDIFQAKPSPARAALVEIDSQIARAAQTLGPNHPRLAQLRRMRETLAQQAKQEADVGESVRAAVAAQARAQAAVLAAQTAKVLSQSKDRSEVQLLQDQIDAKTQAYGDTLKRVAASRQMANTIESGLTPVGEPEALPDPAFPNKALIFGGTGGFGLVAGVLLALLTELLNLRIRTPAGLASAAPVPLLGAVPRLHDAAPAKASRKIRLRRRKLKPAAA
jgi:succinoglycan biosynthesis transport protein ExoP